jgi:hypothetical protein
VSLGDTAQLMNGGATSSFHAGPESQEMARPSSVEGAAQTPAAVVIIGRNEAAHLPAVIASVAACETVVFVDSASTDGSADVARSLGVHVIELSVDQPLSAARARNTGLEWLTENAPGIELVLFLDGDCELVPAFVPAAELQFAEMPDVVAVTGWTREFKPTASIYNLLCDVEWSMGGVGEIKSFGGPVMVRAAAVNAVGGYATDLVAAEDDDLSIRLRRAGGRLWRLDMPIVLHDADIHDFKSYWRRARRCGQAYAQVSERWGAVHERKFVGERRSALLWGAVAPTVSVAAAPFTHGLSLIVLLKYPASAGRQFLKLRSTLGGRAAAAWGASCEVSKFAQAAGIIRYSASRRQRAHSSKTA